ncbi:maleylpyruvate isomerase N-terminal domain-containing protein [Streptomycetaceae bacterium NBC_01309]
MNTVPPLLEQAVRYALVVTREIPPALLSRPTPCEAWDLAMLLAHANESLAALTEGAVGGCVAPAPPHEPEAHEPQSHEAQSHEPEPADRPGPHRVRVGRQSPPRRATDDPVTTFRHRARQLPSLWATAPRLIAVADRAMPADLTAAAGALEIAVHAWDIARSCRRNLPIPAAVAVELLSVGVVLVPESDRHPFFAPRAEVGAMACPSDRLVAFLGRDPR